ncbi:MAG TPA: peptidoglycan DD-metalloendopeptidase family protein [Saprospiraceae bacterium]|nr:peptidoglycan DD-metalloendopeptidase family protein [Saprospiraceae bacterium]
MYKICTFLIFSLLAFSLMQGQVMVHTANGGYLNTKLHQEHYSQESQDQLNAVIRKAFEEADEVAEGQKSVPSFGSPIARSSNSFILNPQYFYSVSAFYDHNRNDNAYHDLNCESLSYDSHRGTDFFSFPFYWYQYENELMDVQAAEEGVIILKVTEADNCYAEGSYGVHMAIQHGNYISIYAHLKEGTLTSKGENDRVVKGEKLGKVGFTGNSASGPHLHFQINTNPDIDANWTVDPYLTTCQSSNESLDLMDRKQEMEYKHTELLSLTTHKREPVWGNSCDDSYLENPFFGDQYQIGDTVVIIAAVRDFSNNQELSISLTDSEGIIKQQWRLDMEDVTGMDPSPRHVTAAYSKLYYVIKETDATGQWSIGAAIREGSELVGTSLNKTCTVEPFTSSTEREATNEITIFPNPCYSSLIVQCSPATKIGQVEMMDLSGYNLSTSVIQNGQGALEINTATLLPGVYLLRLTTEEGQQIIRRVLKQ